MNRVEEGVVKSLRSRLLEIEGEQRSIRKRDIELEKDKKMIHGTIDKMTRWR